MNASHGNYILFGAFLIPVIATTSSLQPPIDHGNLSMASDHEVSINMEALGMTGDRPNGIFNACYAKSSEVWWCHLRYSQLSYSPTIDSFIRPAWLGASNSKMEAFSV